ncbi:MAG: DNA-binding domain-containing protein [Myxococcota bacterium]
MSLHDFQTSFLAALHGRDASSLLPLVASEDATRRIAIYVDMYWGRLIDALAQDFPEVAAMLGSEVFSRVAVTHVERRPSRHPSLAFLGEGLELTLDELGLVREAAVARLEGARNAAFWTPDVPTWVNPRDVAALGPNFAACRVELNPSVRTVAIALGARARVEGDVAAPIDPVCEEDVVVWRATDHVVRHRTMSHGEATALAALRGGATVGEACEAFAACTDPQAAALGAIQEWLSCRFWVTLDPSSR